MDKPNEKPWREMSTAEQLRAFAYFLDPVMADLFLRAADELDELYKRMGEGHA